MNLPEKNAIQQQARDWLVKLETDDMLDGDEDRFVEWLEADEAHSIAFYDAEQTWQTMHQVSADALKEDDLQQDTLTSTSPQNHEVQSNRKEGAKTEEAKIVKLPVGDVNLNQPSKSGSSSTNDASRVRQLFRVMLPLAATFLLAFWTLIWGKGTWLSITTDHYAATGERKVQLLADGSELTLNTDTAVNIHFSDKQRLIELVSGEIYIDVFTDRERPFVVQAGDMQVTALGTEFIVRKDNDTQPTVAVTEHSVKVENLSDLNTQTVVQEGQQVTLLEKRNLITQAKVISIKKVQSWKNGKLVFNNEPLKTVVLELNRYTTSKIVLRDKNLEDLRVTGVLDLEDPLNSLKNLAEQLDLSFNQITPLLIFIEKG